MSGRRLPIPEFTLVAEASDEAKATAAVDRLVRRLDPKQVTSVTQDGVKMTAAHFGAVTIFYGTFDGKLVVTSGHGAIAKLREDGAKLADEEAYKDAKDAAGMPDESAGFLCGPRRGDPAVWSGTRRPPARSVPSMLSENLEPLKSLVLWGELQGRKQRGSLFVQID